MIGIITQARINSSRLPNKIFKEALAKSYLQHHIERLQTIGIPLIVATTNDGSEQPIVEFCNDWGLSCFKGSEQNVLDRFYHCAKENKLDHIVRVTSDCPLIDAAIIKAGVEAYMKTTGNVFYSNALQRTYPRGMDYELFSFSALEEAWQNAELDSDKEHVTPYIWNNRAGNMHIVDDKNLVDDSDLRITLDTAEDETLLRTLIENYAASTLSCAEIVSILRSRPALIAINEAIEQKKI